MTALSREWQRLQRAARLPAHGCARRAREDLRAWVHAQLRQDVGLDQVAWFPIGLPVPEGWELSRDQQAGHHHRYSQLCRRMA